MAQAIFAQEAQKRGLDVESRSAGIATYTGNPASDNAVEAMKEIGIDISAFRSTYLRSILAEDFDYYVPMTKTHADALIQLGIGKHKIYLFDRDIADPYGGNIDFYRQARDELTKEIVKFADFIEKEVGKNGEN